MNVNFSSDVETCQSLEAAAFPADGHVPHTLASFRPGFDEDHFVIGKERAVEEDDIRTAKPACQRLREVSAARNAERPQASGGKCNTVCRTRAFCLPDTETP